MAHIAIDARKYFDFGIGTYIQNLIFSITELKPKHSFSLLLSPHDVDRVQLSDEWQKHVCSYKRYSVGELLFMSNQAKRIGADLFHEPHFTLPIGLAGKSVVTVHDLIHLKMPQFFSQAQRLYARTVIGHAVRHAGAVITDSQQTKDDILNAFNVKAENVEVIHLAVRPNFRRLEDQSAVDRFLSTSGITKPYVLYVGNVKPHKNIPTLLSAFAAVRKRVAKLQLVFIGASYKSDKGLFEQVQRLGISDALIDLQRISDTDLVCAYNGASALVMPSLYEGFGLPVLEAMACGTPTVISTGGSLPEVAGSASLCVESMDAEGLAEKLEKVVTDPETQRGLVAMGKINVQRFSLRATGRKTLDVYDKVLGRWQTH